GTAIRRLRMRTDTRLSRSGKCFRASAPSADMWAAIYCDVRRAVRFEFVVIMLWASLDAIRNFVGADYEAAVVPPDCEALLSRYDERSAHYEIVIQTSARD